MRMEATAPTESDGFAASLDYVQDTMTAAGWDVSRQEFTYDGINLATQQITPAAADYESIAAIETGEGDVTAAIQAVDINLVPPRASTSGCEAADFAGIRCRQHRVDSARHVQLHGQGRKRRGRRCDGRDHLQPGQHAGS